MLAYGALLDLYCFLKFILMMIVPFLGLLVWAENKVPNSNEVSHHTIGEELVQTRDAIDQFFEQDHHEENTISGDVTADCACSFCGKLSHITKCCSRCKAAFYCSKACHVMHWRFWHKYECVEIKAAENQEGSPSRGTHCLLMEPENEISKYSFNQVEQKTDLGEDYYIEGGGEQNTGDSCVVCGNPSTKNAQDVKLSNTAQKTCQRFDWRSGHKFLCVVDKANSTQAAMVNIQERIAQGNVIVPTNSCVEDDNAHSSDPLCLEYYSEGNTNAKALILSYQEATNAGRKEIEEQVKSLKEELAKIKNEKLSLQSERDKWEMQASHAVDKLYSFRKENEHQLFILKHENELISNSEKQARQMVHSLSQRLYYLQIEMETEVADKKKQEEYIHMLQNECAKAKTELQEQKKCVQRLSVGLDEATQFPMRITEGTRQKSTNALGAAAGAEAKLDHPERKNTKPDDQVFQTISLSRNPTYTRQGCAICLTNERDMAFGCGHMTCRDCGSKISKCHICRKKIGNRIRLFPG